jgi:N-acetylglucosaminyldiphosphoundecaprenol N-acetyl-beta-D-mannosaminyltransferase
MAREDTLSELHAPSHGQEIFERDIRHRANVLGVGVDAFDMEQALSRLAMELRNNRKGYVCAIDVHGILEAIHDPQLAETFARSSMALPDGAPTVWVGRLQGHRHIDHVTGPDLMLEVFGQKEFAGYTHFLYGGKAGVAEELAATLCKRFRSARIVGTYTPPFRDLDAREEEGLIARIEELKPDIIWVGIGAPKQDLFMRRMLPCMRTRMMIGVGAAFDFHTGRIRGCPPWVKRAGFQWLHRLAQDPRRLWRRNLKNMSFLWHIATQLSGFRNFPLAKRTATLEYLASPSTQPLTPAFLPSESARSGVLEPRSVDRACSGD